jgi:branched-chain amino acid aminotransferase
MAMNYAKKNGLDECFILNNEGQIIEAAKSNIILVSNGVLYTPPLADGCVGGTMRMKVINTALENRIKVYESSITPQNLLIADEIILTNAISGLQWVGEYKTKVYTNQITRNLISFINESIFNESNVSSN